jgi:hypothetical protein
VYRFLKEMVLQERNSLCYCGSSKKYKHCHYCTDGIPRDSLHVVSTKEGKRKQLFWVTIAMPSLFLAIALYQYFNASTQKPFSDWLIELWWIFPISAFFGFWFEYITARFLHCDITINSSGIYSAKLDEGFIPWGRIITVKSVGGDGVRYLKLTYNLKGNKNIQDTAYLRVCYSKHSMGDIKKYIENYIK